MPPAVNSVFSAGRPEEDARAIDPASFEGYIGFIWPELLDRWLY
jgi:hypothetical protein